jgi:tRNA modification GTPase
MTCSASLMTPYGAGGIAKVQLCGPASISIIETIFRPHKAGRELSLSDGRLVLGSIYDGVEIVDQVIVCCDRGEQTVDINCHGGRRIAQRLLLLLQKSNVEILSRQQFQKADSLVREIDYFMPQAQTRMAVLAIAGQYPGGLYNWACSDIAALREGAKNVEDVYGEIVKLRETFSLSQKMFSRPAVVLAGAANVGKSTLANRLAGADQSIMSDVAGTTRDWTVQVVSMGPLAVKLIDTAGVQTSSCFLEDFCRQQTEEQFFKADMIVLVVSAEGDIERQIAGQMEYLPGDAKPLVVVNKCDLCQLKNRTKDRIYVSALTGVNCEQLRGAIVGYFGFADFDPCKPLIFSRRQYDILQCVGQESSSQEITICLSELIESARVKKMDSRFRGNDKWGRE